MVALMIQVFPVMLLELLICTCNTSYATYFIALNTLWEILETLYTAYYAIGLLAYIVALISYLPFIVSLVRMACRDTETRRLIFYRNCWRMWVFCFLIDLWTIVTIQGSIDDWCEISGFKPDQQAVAKYHGKELNLAQRLHLC